MAAFTQIHDIVYHGNGGYDWETVYNMPLWLRRFTIKQIHTYINNINSSKEKDVVEQTRNNIRAAGFDRSTESKKVAVPDYVAKAGKK